MSNTEDNIKIPQKINKVVEHYTFKKTNVWYPTFGTLSTRLYKETADCRDAQPPKPLPKYKKIKIDKSFN